MTSSYPSSPGDVAAPFAPPLVEELRRLGDEVTVLAFNRGGGRDGDGVRWFGGGLARGALEGSGVLSPRGLVGTLALLAGGERALARLVREQRPDVCLALWAIPAGFLASRMRSRFGLPYVVWALGSDVNTYGRRTLTAGIVRRVLAGARRRLADGVELAEEVRRLSGLECEFLPTTRPLPPPGPERCGGASPRFLFVGRLEPVKGPDLLLQAWRLAVSRGVPGHLTMVGGGSMRDGLEREAGRAGLAGRVDLVPPAGAAAVAAYMASADCLVVPSRSDSIPLVFSEAVQAGLPMLVTEAGDLGRLAREHGLAGPAPVGDPEALAAGMEAVAADLEGFRSRYRESLPGLRGLFDLPATAARLHALLRES